MSDARKKILAALERANEGVTLSGCAIAKATGIAHATVMDCIRQLGTEGLVTMCEVFRNGAADVDARRSLSLKPASFHTQAFVAPVSIQREIHQPTPETTMSRKKQLEAPLTATQLITLRAAKACTDRHPDETNASDIARELDLPVAPVYARIASLCASGHLTKQGNKQNQSISLTPKGLAALEENPSNDAPPEAKTPEKARQQTTFAERIRVSEPLAMINPMPTDDEDDLSGPCRAAITDDGEVLVFDGPPDSTLPTVIAPHLARRLVALLRTLPSSHPLSLES